MRHRVRGEKRLKAKDIASLPSGVHEDGGGQRLVVEPPRGKKPGPRRWVLRVTIVGKRHNRGLGPYPLVNLDRARDAAGDIRRAAREGRGLIAEQRGAQARSVTFRQAHETMFEIRRKAITSEKHVKQWMSAMERYVFSSIGNQLVSVIKHADILATLKPVWFDKPQLGRAVLQRVEAVFQSAIRHGQRENPSPCSGVIAELGRQNHEVEHFRALPYAEVSSFLKKLRISNSGKATKLALEWLILTATRSKEARGARWDEIDERHALWSIPKERMKGRREHVVPLSARCLEILKEARTLESSNGLVFPSPQTGEVMSENTLGWVLLGLGMKDRATVHGLRSSFRDWGGTTRHVSSTPCCGLRR